MRAAFTVFAALTLISGCSGNCRKTTPYVPFLEDAGTVAARDGDVAATDAAVDAGAKGKFQKVQAALAPAGATTWTLDGLSFEAPSGSALIAAIARDLDGDGQRDVVAYTQPTGGGGGELRFHRGDGNGGLLAGRSVTGTTTGSATTLPVPCVAKPFPFMLMLVGPHSVALDLRPDCGEAAPTQRRFVYASFAPTPSIRWSARVADPPFGWDFTIDVDEAKDEDGDGIDDPKLIVALEGGGPPWGPGDRVSAEIKYLDRPAGLSRDRKFPETSFQGHAGRALGLLGGKKPDPARALSIVRRLRILHAAICDEGGAPWLEIGSARGVPCFPSNALETAALAEVKAALAAGDVILANAARDRLASPAVASTKKIREQIDKALDGAAPEVRGTAHELKVSPSTPSKGAPAWGALAFDESGKLLVRAANDVVRVDPASFAEAPLTEVSPWPWEVTLPGKDARLTSVIDPCDAPNLAARFAGHDVPTGASLLAIAALPKTAPSRCPGGATVPAVPIAWDASGLFALVGHEPTIIPSAMGKAGAPLTPSTRVSGGFVQGSPRSPNGTWLVIPTRFGILRRDETSGAASYVRVTALEGLYAQLRECAISNSGERIACVRENKVVLIDATAAPPPLPAPEE